MGKKEILVIGEVSYKILSSLNGISNKYIARKSTIGAENVVEALEGYPPDIVVAFVNNVNTGDISRIKKTFDKLKYTSIPIICVGTEAEYDFVKRTFNGYEVHGIMLPLSISKLNQLIKEILERQIDINYKEDDETDFKQYYDDSDKKHILVVDDDVKILRLISAYLNDEYKVAVVNSGAAAIAYIGKKKPDLILLDYLMPVCDGKQTLEMIRDLKDMQDIPVIFLTGVSDKEVVTECLKLNPQGYILKPVSKEKLLDKLNKIFMKK